MPTKSPTTNPTIVPDPDKPGSIIRKAFLLEALANLFTLPLLTHTHWTLSLFTLHPSQITPPTILFARLFGGIVVFGLTSALLVGATNTRNGIESRRPTYLLLGMGEAGLIPILLLEAGKGGGKDASLSVRSAWVASGVLAGTLVWRCWVVFGKPEWLGRYMEEGEEGKAGGGGTRCKPE